MCLPESQNEKLFKLLKVLLLQLVQDFIVQHFHKFLVFILTHFVQEIARSLNGKLVFTLAQFIQQIANALH